MKRLIFAALLVLANCADAQEYSIENLPTALKIRANAVVRNEELKVIMEDESDVSYQVKQAITVLNKNGERNTRLTLYYSKNAIIKSAKGEVYDEFGKQTGKFGISAFADESAVSNFSLFEDDRVKHYLPTVNEFPYTVVYTYEIKFKQNLIIPTWRPQPSNDVAVEKSTFTFICKADEKIRINEKNLQTKPTNTNDGKLQQFTWNIAHLKAYKKEVYAPDADSFTPSVKIAPVNFSYFNVRGSYKNWQELGKWVYDVLLKDRQKLPPATVDQVKKLVADIDDPKEKAKKLYEYLQRKTRYISVQIGIGGFRPFKAEDVDQWGYGDCKALVNYMQSLLAVADIPSYYCAVKAGAEKTSFERDFAGMDQGNHVILCIPFKNDTTWLECTSQKIPFGFLGDFTDDRDVLACTPEGGKLIRTPKYSANDNLQIRKADFILDENGDLQGNMVTSYHNICYDLAVPVMGLTPAEQEKSLTRDYDINNIEFKQINFSEYRSARPKLTEQLTINIRNFATRNDGKVHFVPNAFNQKSTITAYGKRTLPFEIKRGYTDIDTITYTLAKNMQGSFMPVEKKIDNKFGSYQYRVESDGHKIVCYRKMVLKEGDYAPAEFENFTSFVNEVANTDRLKLILSEQPNTQGNTNDHK